MTIVPLQIIELFKLAAAVLTTLFLLLKDAGA
jgi:hypothetical protein